MGAFRRGADEKRAQHGAVLIKRVASDSAAPGAVIEIDEVFAAITVPARAIDSIWRLHDKRRPSVSGTIASPISETAPQPMT